MFRWLCSNNICLFPATVTAPKPLWWKKEGWNAWWNERRKGRARARAEPAASITGDETGRWGSIDSSVSHPPSPSTTLPPPSIKSSSLSLPLALFHTYTHSSARPKYPESIAAQGHLSFLWHSVSPSFRQHHEPQRHGKDEKIKKAELPILKYRDALLCFKFGYLVE